MLQFFLFDFASDHHCPFLSLPCLSSLGARRKGGNERRREFRGNNAEEGRDGRSRASGEEDEAEGGGDAEINERGEMAKIFSERGRERVASEV